MIKHDKRIENKYKPNKHRTIENITEIVIHGTAGGQSAEALIKWMLNPRDIKQSARYHNSVALFHYLIDYNGDIIQLLPLDRWANHSSSGEHDKKTIAIELMNGDRLNAAPFRAAQYESLVNLIEQLRPELQNLSKITSHERNALIYSQIVKDVPCPGNFHWPILSHFKNQGIEVIP